jgi:hypothetical protein
MLRSKHEGLSFLTITLPDFGKDFQKSLDRKQVDPDSFLGFKRRAGLPQFLGGFLDLVFDRTSGRLLDEPSIDAILAIRQLTLVFGKVLFPCSDTRVRAAMRGYIQCEQDVREWDRDNSHSLYEFEQMSGFLYQSMFSSIDRDIYIGNVVPKHGPGVTADRLLGNKKFTQRTWTSRLEEIFPFGEYLFPSHSYYDKYDDVNILEPDAEMPVRVIPVPKTQKTPRIIAIEPTAMQYMQQGILELLLRYIERDDILSHMLGFRYQEPNQLMAREGSLRGTLATLDLSEASDRVSNQLVRAMTARSPWLHKALDATRSRRADVPGHGVVRLAKFASMGSATCFPVEAMTFLVIVLLGIQDSLNRPLTARDLRSLVGRVRIYGDDIIVPVDHVHSVVRRLGQFNALVNGNKSFWNGKFRESCGKEYFAGHDVSIVKVRNLFPSRRTDVTEIISICSLRNQLYHAGYWATVGWLDSIIRGILSNHYPNVAESSSVLGRICSLGVDVEAADPDLHSPLVKGYVVTATPPRNSLDGSDAMLKFFLKRAAQPYDEDHLERSGRPQAVYTKLRWSSPL